MKTYNVFVTKTGTEHYTVSAASFEAALVDFEARNPALREATNDSIESVTIEDHETGERRASGDIRKDEVPEPPFTFDVTIGANLRCYATLEVEADSQEDARAKAMKILEDEGDCAANNWGWTRESVEGKVSMQAENRDTGEGAEFVDMPFWTGPNYALLESIVRDLTVIKLSGDVPNLARLVNRAKEAFHPLPPAVM
jgi:hypothetical protein